MPTASRQVTINNKNGLHARPVMAFVDVATRFRSVVRVCVKDGEERCVDGKSVLQMITLEALDGTTLRIDADGEDAQQAVNELAGLVERNFGE